MKCGMYKYISAIFKESITQMDLSDVNNIATNWRNLLQELMQNFAFRNALDQQVAIERETGLVIYPPANCIFEAFKHFNIHDTKVVIVGQDPYHRDGEANGLCFSVNDGIKIPPSLRNIFAEVENEFGIQRRRTDLTDWAKQGVLLLNRSLTVRNGFPNSHYKLWHSITESIIRYLAENTTNCVFMLWGDNARSCNKWISTDQHLLLEHTHPSPLARRKFIGNHHFRLCNDYLLEHGKQAIDWLGLFA